MQAIVNDPIANRIQLKCDPYAGPFHQNGALEDFDPRRDLEVYIDGTRVAVRSYTFDSANNRYLIFVSQPILTTAVVQIICHMPDPPFIEGAYVPPPPPPLQWFGMRFGFFGG